MITQDRLHRMADDLIAVEGVSAVTLGGSRARGAHRPDSDVYYERGRLDGRALEVLAERWGGAPVQVARPGGWGPWVDGGAWLTIDETPVDWILRDLDRVREQCERANHGQFAFFTQPGHPLGFLDVAYAGEAATAVELSRRLASFLPVFSANKALCCVGVSASRRASRLLRSGASGLMR